MITLIIGQNLSPKDPVCCVCQTTRILLPLMDATSAKWDYTCFAFKCIMWNKVLFRQWVAVTILFLQLSFRMNDTFNDQETQLRLVACLGLSSSKNGMLKKVMPSSAVTLVKWPKCAEPKVKDVILRVSFHRNDTFNNHKIWPQSDTYIMLYLPKNGM